MCLSQLERTLNQSSTPNYASGHDEALAHQQDLHERALIEAAIAGDARARFQVWQRQVPMVVALLRRGLGASSEIEDLVHDVFLRLFSRLHTIGNLEAIRSFTYSVALRVLREQLRRQKRQAHRELPLDSLTCDAVVAPGDFESRELLRQVEARLLHLDPRLKETLRLRRWDGLELSEVASELGISLATVKRDLGRANRLLTAETEMPAASHRRSASTLRCVCASAA